MSLVKKSAEGQDLQKITASKLHSVLMMEQGLRGGCYRWRYRKSLAKEHSGDCVRFNHSEEIEENRNKLKTKEAKLLSYSELSTNPQK